MHDRHRHDLKDAIGEMSDSDKLELIEELAHSLRSSKNGDNTASTVERQLQAFSRLQERLANLAPVNDPYAHLGYTNEAHDKILYDLEQK